MKGRVFFPPFLFSLLTVSLTISCLYTKTNVGTIAGAPERAQITIAEGNAVLSIQGYVNHDVYSWFANELSLALRDERFDRPIVTAGTRTRNETRRLFSGDEVSFSIMPSEIVTVNIVSMDGDNVTIIINDTRRGARTHVLAGENRMGLTVAFIGR